MKKFIAITAALFINAHSLPPAERSSVVIIYTGGAAGVLEDCG